MTLLDLTTDRAFADVPTTTSAATHTLPGLAPDAGIEVLPGDGGSEDRRASR